VDRLIDGKNEIAGIVCIEVKDDKAILFVENQGQISTIEVPNRYWILTEQQYHASYVRLKGNLNYQYGKQFTKRSEFLKVRKQLQHAGCNFFSIYNEKEALMVKDGYTYFKGMKHQDVSVMAIDIETTGLVHDETSDVLLIACTLRKNGILSRKLFAYDEYSTRAEMLIAFADYVREADPSIILGHNIFIYDLPYLEFIAKKLGVELNLGRDGSALWFDDFESKYRKDATQFYHYRKAHVFGRELVDTMFVSLRYDVGRKYESYGLKPIIRAEGLEVEGRVFYDASRIRFTYKDPEEWKKIKLYAGFDGDDALAIYDLMSPPFFYLTQHIPKPYQLILESAAGSQINAMMIRSYLQEGHSLPKASEAIPYEGAISFGNPGVYRNVFKVDVASLYPNIMLQYGVYDSEKDPNGNFLKLVSTFTERRLKHKKLAKRDKYYDDLQNAEKIFINSCYGFMGASGLLFNSPAKAAYVTEQGRIILQKALSWGHAHDFHIVNADTDSISFSEREGTGFSVQQRADYLKELNSLFPERIRFEDDGYYDTVIVAAGKNYALFKDGKVKYKGSALKATTREPALKEFIHKVINQIAEYFGSSTDCLDAILQETYESFVHEIQNITDIRRWVTRKTITEKVINAKRTNEQKVKDAIAGTEYVEGDRAYFYFASDGSLRLAENFDGDYDRDKLFEKLYKTACIFDTIINVKKLFPNYKLKKNKRLLDLNQLSLL